MSNYASFIWSIADLLRGNFKAHQYGDFILPFTVLRRLDSVLADTKPQVLEVIADAEAKGIPVRPVLLRTKAGHQPSFYNTSPYDLNTLVGDAENLRENLLAYINAFSENVRDIFVKYKIEDRIEELEENNLLLMVLQRFAGVDLHPERVSNDRMGHIFEELIRKFAEASNETAGEHFTPREVIELMVDLLFDADGKELINKDIVRSVYDPTAGTGGMLSVAEDHLRAMNPNARLTLAGQELNAQSYAICKADMIIKGQSVDAIVNGDTLKEDGHAGTTFNYCLSNPPFGTAWNKSEKEVREEFDEKGFAGRFGPGLPRVSDGSMLFLMHLISKMREPGKDSSGGRAAIVLNGSPLFTGAAGSGESNIRKWILERDYLEAIIALPTDMFYNTGISTYVWVLSKQKAADRVGKVQLIDGSDMFRRMRKGLGSKRNELGPDDINALVKLYGKFEETEQSKIFGTTDFFYRTITVERPLKLCFSVTADRTQAVLSGKAFAKLSLDEQTALRKVLEGLNTGEKWKNRDVFTKRLKQDLVAAGVSISGPQLKVLISALSERDDTADVCMGPKGKSEPDTELRDTENVPWNEDIQAYLGREILPFVPDAWIDETKTKEGCEIPFTRHFYQYLPPRSLGDIDRDLDAVLGRIRARLEAVKA
ncbi:class I SAM-dependent DNA methyltransferase [Arthrobacter oryzae]|uniref:site-specific DNA-methyltransferase (adenine-specific) n=1 Tax=Arthrobacter oryzae TaxID=409290 RepID=A0A3N0BS88_9MICC|nr:class I SAM-dependent DNA methyltransferase [Arthrobacter oryzae]RNL51866.1 SAM-dependent DNA methyltransferase [Arthrobacter oryzae]